MLQTNATVHRSKEYLADLFFCCFFFLFLQSSTKSTPALLVKYHLASNICQKRGTEHETVGAFYWFILIQ